MHALIRCAHYEQILCVYKSTSRCHILLYFSLSTVKAALATWKNWAVLFADVFVKGSAEWGYLLSRRWASSAFVISHLRHVQHPALTPVYTCLPKWLWPMTDLTYNGCLFTRLFPAVADNQSFRFETYLIFRFLLKLKSKSEINSNMSFTLFIILIFLYQE